MNTLGIIIARGGSVGLPNKHLRQLLGRSVVQYTLDHALQSRSLRAAAVSTDIPELLHLARRQGFLPVARPPRLSTDTASVQDALLHALEAVESETARRFDQIVLLYGNIPVRPGDLVDRAVELLQSSGCDSVRSFCPVGKWHPAWMSRLEGTVVQPLQEGSIHRRQDLAPLYIHDGGVVAVTRRALLHALQTPGDPHAFFGADRRGVLTQPHDVVEIDRELDLYLAEAILRARAAAGEAQQDTQTRVAS